MPELEESTWLVSKGLPGWWLCQQLLGPIGHLVQGWLEVAESDLGYVHSTLTGHHHQAEPMLPLESCLGIPGPYRLVQFSGLLSMQQSGQTDFFQQFGHVLGCVELYLLCSHLDGMRNHAFIQSRVVKECGMLAAGAHLVQSLAYLTASFAPAVHSQAQKALR